MASAQPCLRGAQQPAALVQGGGSQPQVVHGGHVAPLGGHRQPMNPLARSSHSWARRYMASRCPRSAATFRRRSFEGDSRPPPASPGRRPGRRPPLPRQNMRAAAAFARGRLSSGRNRSRHARACGCDGFAKVSATSASFLGHRQCIGASTFFLFRYSSYAQEAKTVRHFNYPGRP